MSGNPQHYFAAKLRESCRDGAMSYALMDDGLKIDLDRYTGIVGMPHEKARAALNASDHIRDLAKTVMYLASNGDKTPAEMGEWFTEENDHLYRQGGEARLQPIVVLWEGLAVRTSAP